MSQRKHHLCLWVFIPRDLYKEEEGARPTGGWQGGDTMGGWAGLGAAGCVDDGGDEYWEESFMGQGGGGGGDGAAKVVVRCLMGWG